MPTRPLAAAYGPLLMLLCAQAMIAGVAAQGSQAGVQVALPQAFPVRFFVVGDWGRASDS